MEHAVSTATLVIGFLSDPTKFSSKPGKISAQMAASLPTDSYALKNWAIARHSARMRMDIYQKSEPSKIGTR